MAVHVSDFNATETRILETDGISWLLLPGLLSHTLASSPGLPWLQFSASNQKLEPGKGGPEMGTRLYYMSLKRWGGAREEGYPTYEIT